MSNQVKTFETYDVDLASYLMLEGLKFIECKLDPSSQEKSRVILVFFDEKGVARDLERVFMGSRFLQYRQFHKYLLKSIHRTIKKGI